MSKVIFLDIDGVLNSNFWNHTHQFDISDGTLIDRDNIKMLAELVRRTGAEIILHSGWKYWFDDGLNPLRSESEKLQTLLLEEGLRISSVTPDHATEEIKRAKKFSLVKADEILAYVKAHQDVEEWVVIDDLDLHNAEVERHQLRTDAQVGLTAEDITVIEKLLSHISDESK